MNLLKITETYEYTHMPWISADEIPEKLFLFCLQINGVWKIHYAENDGIVHRLTTGLPDAAYECAPVAVRSGDSWQVSFVAGNSLEHKNLSLYVQRLTDTAATPIVFDIHSGFYVSDKFMGYSRYGGIFYAKNMMKPTAYKIANATNILCMRPGPKGGILISYDSTDDTIVTLQVLLTSKKVYKLTDKDGDALYKACFNNGVWYYAKKTGESFEERKILSIESPRIESLDFDTYIDSGPVTSIDDLTSKTRPIQDILFELPKDLR